MPKIFEFFGLIFYFYSNEHEPIQCSCPAWREGKSFCINNDGWEIKRYLELKKFKRFGIENVNIVGGKNWDLIFPLEQLYAGKIV